jgi:hypothetical protein
LNGRSSINRNSNTKTKIMKKGIIFLMAAVLAFTVTSCDNAINQNIDTSSDSFTIAEDEISALKSEETTDEEVSTARFAAHYANFVGPRMVIPRHFFGPNFPDCAEVTVEGETFPKTITIVYGEDCISRRGNTKTGTMIITISDTITNPGASYNLEYVDMVIGGKNIEKSATITNEGMNDAGNWVMSSESVTSVTKNDTLMITRAFSQSKEWLEGFDTHFFSDDIFLKTGGGTISVNGDVKFEREIIEPLLIDRACRFILSGVIEITRNEESMYLDFGDGECDNIAVVTKDGESEEIELISGRFRREFQRQDHNMNRKQGWW